MSIIRESNWETGGFISLNLKKGDAPSFPCHVREHQGIKNDQSRVYEKVIKFGIDTRFALLV